MTDPPLTTWLAELEQALDRIDGELDAGAGDREALKASIVGLYKSVDSAQTGLTAVRERLRSIVDRYKRQGAESNRPEPEPQPVPVRADHLGASTYIDKGWSLISLGDPAGAVQALNRALELAPGDVQATALLGWAQMVGREYDRALATFSQVLAREPAHALARVSLGYICLKKKIFGEAIEHLSRVIRLDNDRKATLYANYYLGLVYLEREMYLDAQTFLAKAIALGPNLIEAYYDLGRAQWFAGDQEAARATWRKGAGANRFAPWSRRCQELLDAVERGEPVPRSSAAA